MSTLLPFHSSILQQIHDPATSDLLLLARGLGMRRLICMLLKIYDSPQNLVLLVNAQDEQTAIGEELGILGCRNPGLRIIGYETPAKDRQDIYKAGGVISVTSQILTVDLLTGDAPTELITGLIILHAESVTPLAPETFIVRLFREKNKKGFVKAFSDAPERIRGGLSPLKTVMKNLQLRNVYIYPRFHEEIRTSLSRPCDVIEWSQSMTEAMSTIHYAIIQCMNDTLAELKRSHGTLDLDEFKLENAYFRNFDTIVRYQLDTVWHKVGPKTKQFINDLNTLRNMLEYLMTYDALRFHSYLEMLIAENSYTFAGTPRQNRPLWMESSAAMVIFSKAKERCYLMTAPAVKPPVVIDLAEDEEGWEALDSVGGISSAGKGKGKDARDGATESIPGLPEGMEPTLEEHPKWNLLADVIHEADGRILEQNIKDQATTEASNTTLVMTSSTHNCALLTKFLSCYDPSAPAGARGRTMMLGKLYEYLWWKSALAKEQAAPAKSDPKRPTTSEPMSEALRRKNQEIANRQQNRRRVRGGAPGGGSGREDSAPPVKAEPKEVSVGEIQDEAFVFKQFSQKHSRHGPPNLPDLDLEEELDFDDDFGFDEYYGVIAPEETVVVRKYADDADDRMLEDLRPKSIILYEPNLDFIRRIEVYKNSHPEAPVRVYLLVYSPSSEEQKYLTTVQREKVSFERLIQERATMVLTIDDRGDITSANDSIIKTISSRLGGGRREINTEPPQVIVDMREFRSALPSLVHAAELRVVPATLTVGDYILTPDICVERKSLPDLISSFNSGRLYSQCELMCSHYKQPMLLIEFEEEKGFSLEVVNETKSYVKPTAKQSGKRSGGSEPPPIHVNLQSKIVLLLIAFPRLKVIWSSSPFATADIFKDLKEGNPEPDPVKAISVGAEDDPNVGAGVNQAAEDLLRSIPGITAKNIKFVMSRVRNVRELCELDLAGVQKILGVDAGKKAYEFMHRGERK